jgi:hypothetical protein
MLYVFFFFFINILEILQSSEYIHFLLPLRGATFEKEKGNEF